MAVFAPSVERARSALALKLSYTLGPSSSIAVAAAPVSSVDSTPAVAGGEIQVPATGDASITTGSTQAGVALQGTPSLGYGATGAASSVRSGVASAPLTAGNAQAGKALALAQATPAAPIPSAPISPPPPGTPVQSPANANAAVQRPPYVDRVINEKEAAEDPRGAAGEGGGQPPGRRSFSAIYALSDSTYSNGAGYREQGVEFRGQRETRDYGIFDYTLSGYLAQNRDGPNLGVGSTLAGRQDGSRLTVSQSRFALNDTKLMDNALGAVYTQGSPLVSRSFRNYLVSSPVLGISSRIYDNAGTEYNFTSGRIGQFSGSTASGFNTTQGEMTGLGMQSRLNRNWAYGTQVWVVKGAQGVADHTSVGLAGDYASSDGAQRRQLRGIFDDHNRVALWFDGEDRTSAFYHHYGLFRFQQDVTWADYPVASGQQGAYWRADARGVGRNYSMGAEYTESNYQRNSTQPTTRSALAFGTINQRVDRLSNVGGTLNLRLTQNLNPPAGTVSAPNTDRLDAQVFASRETLLGTTRLQVNFGASLRNGGDRSQGLQWDQEVNRLGFATTLAYSDDYDQTLGRSHRASAALLLRGFYVGSAYAGGNVNVYQLRSDARATENGTQVAGNMRWQLSGNWSFQGNLSWRRTRNPDLNILGNPPADEKLVMFTLRYDSVSGVPYYSPGNLGPTASSRISGTVFFDDNNDGMQQAGEKPAVGVTVVLDNVYRVVTDATGRYEFVPIGPGSHRLSLQVDKVPLPWGLLDDAPRAVDAQVRGAAEVMFPLVRLNQ